MEFDRQTTCCFTGHRPDKLDIDETQTKQKLEIAIDKAINQGFTTFISGLADGTDLWAAEIVLEKRKNNENIKLICALPYPSFQNKVTTAINILQSANETYSVCTHYCSPCFQMRNCSMVDKSTLVIAAYNGENGGTKNTVKYAKKKGIEIMNVL